MHASGKGRGTAEREEAKAIIERHSPGSTRRLTLGADKDYDTHGRLRPPGLAFTFVMAAHDLVRLAKLIAGNVRRQAAARPHPLRSPATAR